MITITHCIDSTAILTVLLALTKVLHTPKIERQLALTTAATTAPTAPTVLATPIAWRTSFAYTQENMEAVTAMSGLAMDATTDYTDRTNCTDHINCTDDCNFCTHKKGSCHDFIRNTAATSSSVTHK
jgi:hypothetical protein